ncbi:hypothetical protein E2C01_037752 [Portunus trituberculatus]|uniref:Uncharacterized protein n=1 Tax=Portunus trituberculatus TaxID=210409 RepID=A0A5B7F8Y3_PORTR|nr:hypothetical protein [Portunus trituberculatus]
MAKSETALPETRLTQASKDRPGEQEGSSGTVELIVVEWCWLWKIVVWGNVESHIGCDGKVVLVVGVW